MQMMVLWLKLSLWWTNWRLLNCCYNPETCSIASQLALKILYLLPRYCSCFLCWDPYPSITHTKQQQQQQLNSATAQTMHTLSHTPATHCTLSWQHG